MALDNSDVVDFSVFGVELPRLTAYAKDVYGCLLNNGMYMLKCHSASRALDVRKTRRITTKPQLS